MLLNWKTTTWSRDLPTSTAIRYALPASDEWHTTGQWPPADAIHHEWAPRADGELSHDEGETGSRRHMTLGAGLNRAQASPSDPTSMLTWTSAPVDVVGDVELRLDARATAADTAWIATLQDVAPDGTVTDVTAGRLRATMREVDETTSRPGAPVLPSRRAVAVPTEEVVAYRIPLVPSARRFGAGHSIRLVLTSADQDPDTPAIISFRHATSAPQLPQHRPVVLKAPAAHPRRLTDRNDHTDRLPP